jgi:hypothetical protein
MFEFLCCSWRYSTFLHLHQSYSDEIHSAYKYYLDFLQEDFYDDSPFGCIQYAENQLAAKFPHATGFEFLETIDYVVDDEFYETCFLLDTGAAAT